MQLCQSIFNFYKILFISCIFLFISIFLCVEVYDGIFLKRILKINFMKRKIFPVHVRRGVSLAISCIVLAILDPVSVFAQDTKGRQFLQNVNQSLLNLIDTLVTLMRTVMGLGAIITLIVVVFKIYKGEREAAEKLAWWVAGLTLGFVMLQVVSTLIR